MEETQYIELLLVDRNSPAYPIGKFFIAYTVDVPEPKKYYFLTASLPPCSSSFLEKLFLRTLMSLSTIAGIYPLYIYNSIFIPV